MLTSSIQNMPCNILFSLPAAESSIALGHVSASNIGFTGASNDIETSFAAVVVPTFLMLERSTSRNRQVLSAKTEGGSRPKHVGTCHASSSTMSQFNGIEHLFELPTTAEAKWRRT